MEYNNVGFNLLTSRRPFYLLELMQMYSKIIYTDVDVIWKKDPRPYFKGDFHFWAQIAGVISGQPYFEGFIPFICTGFLALKSSDLMKSVLRTWHETVSKDPQQNQDQNVFQNIVFDAEANFGVLSMNYFPCGRPYFEIMSEETRKDAVIIHNNYVIGKQNKVDRFKQHNLWSLDFLKGMSLKL